MALKLVLQLKSRGKVDFMNFKVDFARETKINFSKFLSLSADVPTHTDYSEGVIHRYIYGEYHLTQNQVGLYHLYRLDMKAPDSVMTRQIEAKLSVRELAEALYEGTPHLQNLAEKLARQHGKAEALTFFNMTYPEVQNFWMGIAQQLIDHSSKWEQNNGSSCVLGKEELERLKKLPKHPEL